MKASRQTDHIKSGLVIGEHSLFKKLGETIARKIFSDTKLSLSMSNKTVSSNGTITAVLTGFIVDDGEIGDKIQQSMNDIKNVNTLIGLLE